MKSSSQTESKPCPCGNVCDCHKPKEGMSDFVVILIFLLLLTPMFAFLFIISAHMKSEPLHIEVNGQDCIIKYHEDGRSSTGAPYGHDMADCQK